MDRADEIDGRPGAGFGRFPDEVARRLRLDRQHEDHGSDEPRKPGEPREPWEPREAPVHLIPLRNASTSPTVLGRALERLRNPDASSRNESSMRTPMSAYLRTAGCTLSMNAMFS